MKKIFIVLNIIIMCLCLSSCKEEEIKYKDEIIELVYSPSFDLGRYGVLYDLSHYVMRGNFIDLFLPLDIDINNKFYEGTIIEKKVIAGFHNEKTVNKMYQNLIKLQPDRQQQFENVYNKNEMSIYGISYIYEMAYELYKWYPEEFNIHDYDVSLYSFEDGIPYEYNNEKLSFVVNYYKIKLNNGREIVSVGYCEGNIIDNYFYPDLINFNTCEPLNYGKFIYQEREYTNVIDYSDLRFNVIVEEYEIKCSTQINYDENDIKLFNYFKDALSDDTPNKNYEPGCYYYFDYNKLKDILVK